MRNISTRDFTGKGFQEDCSHDLFFCRVGFFCPAVLVQDGINLPTVNKGLKPRAISFSSKAKNDRVLKRYQNSLSNWRSRVW
jgi:hypothetical protein